METENNRNVSIAVGTAIVVLSNAPNTSTFRKYITIQNNSTAGQKITISFTDEAVAGQGEVLSPGGLHHESVDAGFKPTQNRIIAISDAAGGTVSVSERTVTRS
jgi:hypothetical protein